MNYQYCRTTTFAKLNQISQTLFIKNSKAIKKTIIFTLFLFASATANAQLRWDARVGANVSQFSEGDAVLKRGLQTGVTAEYGFSQLFALRPGVRFSMKGSSDGTGFAAGFPSEFNRSYIEIPVLASFRFPITERFALALNAGPYIGYRINKARKFCAS